MIRKSLVDVFDLSSPVLSAGMPLAGCPRLVAAVSNAGGMGFLGVDTTSACEVTDMIRATRRLTRRPFGVSFSTPFVTQDQMDRCVDEKPAVVAFSREKPQPRWVQKLHDAGIAAWRHVASPAEGRLAAEQGADAVIVDGGGMSSTPPYWPLINLLPATVEAVFPRPAIAAGGIDDGRRLAAALLLGADAAWCGARFLAATEVVELRHRTRTVSAVGPSRLTVGQSIVDLAVAPSLADLYQRTAPGLPGAARGRASAEIKPAAEIVREMTQEASAVLNELYSTLRPSLTGRD